MKLRVLVLPACLFATGWFFSVRGDDTSAAATLEQTGATETAAPANQEPEEEVIILTHCCFVVPEHEWVITLADSRFGLIDYGSRTNVIWNDEHLGSIPCSAPKLAAGIGISFLFLLIGAATLRPRGGGGAEAS